MQRFDFIVEKSFIEMEFLTLIFTTMHENFVTQSSMPDCSVVYGLTQDEARESECVHLPNRKFRCNFGKRKVNFD